MSQWVLEWSKNQNCFHIHPVERTLALNQQKFINDEPINDYHVIFIGEKDVCHTMADNWRRRLIDRSSHVLA